ncbi:MAG TPA: OstA-like protein [Bacteroidia bacterium]|nr:OstA-like protein [Bacteroidia bacterium]
MIIATFPDAMRVNRIFLFLIVLTGFFHCEVSAQTSPTDGKQVNVKHADVLKGDKSHGYQRLVGNVVFEHQGTIMTCDSAHFFLEQDSLNAFGHVHISQGDTVNIWGDRLNYNGNTRQAQLLKNVRMTDKDMTLTTDAINYDMNAKVASYSSGGKIISKANTLTSQIGAYSTEAKMLTFKKNVVLLNPEYVMNCDTLRYMPVPKVAYFIGPTTIKANANKNFIYCENGFYDTFNDVCQFQKNAYILTQDQELRGDSIWYNRRTGLGKAMQNVQIIDTAQKMTITGDLAIHNENTDVSTVTGHALYIQAFSKDSLFLHADTLKAVTIADTTKRNEDDTAFKKQAPKRNVFAYRNVRIYKPDMQGKCDSLFWASSDSIMQMFGDPVLWSGGSQLTSETIFIHTSHGEISQLDMQNSAFIVSKEDSGQFNQIKGKKMTGYFKNNELNRIYVEGNAQTLYYAKDDSTLIGINRADCTRILIGVEDDEVKTIMFYDSPEATLYPPGDLSPKEALLKDFHWRGDEQPKTVDDLFLR